VKKAAIAVLLLFLAVVLVSSGASRVSSAQTARADEARETIRARMVRLLGYVGLEKNASRSDVDKMVELWLSAARPGLSADERTAAFRDLFIQFKKLQGVDYSARPQAVQSLAQRAATLFESGARLDLRLPEPRGHVSGDYIHVETRGRGPVSMLQIGRASCRERV